MLLAGISFYFGQQTGMLSFMKRFFSLLLIAALLTSCTKTDYGIGCVFAGAELEPSFALSAVTDKPYVPGQVLVQYQTGLESQSLEPQSAATQAKALRQLSQDVARDYRGNVVKEATAYRPSLLQLPQGESVEAAVQRLERDPRVAYAEPNYFLELLGVPNDPELNKQWHLLEFGLREAWEVETGTGSVVVSIIDSGVDTMHEDLQGKLLPGCDFFDRDDNPAPDSSTPDAAHGTHVAGIAAATGNNALGVAGVAYGDAVKLLPIKIFDQAGGRATIDNLIEAMLWSAGLPVDKVGTNPNPADIINMSLGVDQEKLKSGSIQSVNSVAKRIRKQGVILFAASGNDPTGSGDKGVFFPASSPFVYSVGSVDSDRRRSAFSHYTPGENEVDFMAPGGVQLNTGDLVLSTYPEDDEGNKYGYQQGTSMAAPFVAGIAALLLSQDAALTPDELAAKLTGSALFESYMTRDEYGVGIVCADRALGAATQCGQ